MVSVDISRAAQYDKDLDQEIREAITRHNGKLPIVNRIRSKIYAVHPDDIVGYVTSITDNSAHIELNLSGVEMLKRGELSTKLAQFYFAASATPPGTEKVGRDTIAMLRPVIPVTVIDGGVTFVKGEATNDLKE